MKSVLNNYYVTNTAKSTTFSEEEFSESGSNPHEEKRERIDTALPHSVE